jgi:rubrerythrin
MSVVYSNYNYYSDEESYYSDEESYYSYNEELKELNNKRAISPFEITEHEEKRCNICLTNKKNYACVPCGHLCLCGTCSKNINKNCPICNNGIDNIIRIFN